MLQASQLVVGQNGTDMKISSKDPHDAVQDADRVEEAEVRPATDVSEGAHDAGMTF